MATWIKIRRPDGMTIWINPAQVIYAQLFDKPRAESLGAFYGEIVAPGGAFKVYSVEEMDAALRVLGMK